MVKGSGQSAGVVASTGIPGFNDLVYDMDPVDDPVIEVPDSDAFTFASVSTPGEDEEFSLFARPYMKDATQFRIISKFTNAGDREWGLFTTGGAKIFFALYDAGNRQLAIQSVADYMQFEDKLISVCATYDGSNTVAGMKLYMNGFLISTTDESSGGYTGMTNTNVIVRIGMLEGFSSADGQLSQVFVLNSDLSASEVLKLHTKNTHPLDEIAHWGLDGDADDDSGNGHNGTNFDGTFVPPL